MYNLKTIIKLFTAGKRKHKKKQNIRKYSEEAGPRVSERLHSSDSDTVPAGHRSPRKSSSDDHMDSNHIPDVHETQESSHEAFFNDDHTQSSQRFWRRRYLSRDTGVFARSFNDDHTQSSQRPDVDNVYNKTQESLRVPLSLLKL